MAKILILTHCSLGQSLIDAAEHIMPGSTADTVYTLSAEPFQSINDLRIHLKKLCGNINVTDESVIIMVDVPGASPANACANLNMQMVRVVSGVNLPMLLKAINYQNEPLDELVALLLRGGLEGVKEIK